MTLQTGSGFLVNMKVEVTEGTAATGGGSTGERLRVLSGPGLHLARGTIRSEEKRNDGNKGKVRLGAKSVEGEYRCEASEASLNTLIEAAFRSTWVAAATTTFNNGAALTSITVDSSSQLTFAGTTAPAAFGLCVGDVFRLANMSTAANNDVNCRVKTISGSVVTVWGTPLTAQGADTACSLVIQKKLSQATTPTRRTFTFEEYFEETDTSYQYVGVRVTSMRWRFLPNAMVEVTFGLMGLNRTALATGASPYFTSPTEYTTLALVADDSSIAYNGSLVTNLTGWTIDFVIAADGPAVIGSVVKPGTFDNDLEVTGEITGLISDFSDDTLYDAETEIEMSIMLTEPESEPKSFIHFYAGAVKITDIAGDKGGDGAFIQRKAITLNPRVAATGYNAGVGTFCTSA